jgi:hypothetical protein
MTASEQYVARAVAAPEQKVEEAEVRCERIALLRIHGMLEVLPHDTEPCPADRLDVEITGRGTAA